MEEYLNAVCDICGKKYHVCGACKKTREFTPWRKIADSINCYKIFMILSEYSNGHTNKETAKQKLAGCDLTDLENFRPGIRDTIQKIMR